VIDDQALVVNVRDRGPVVITGCATGRRNTSGTPCGSLAQRLCGLLGGLHPGGRLPAGHR
jgi:metal-dependent hydrolase (beta-lactamase superfamily II)